MTDQLRKRIFKKRKVKTLTFSIANGISIEVNTYALIRPTLPGISLSTMFFLSLFIYLFIPNRRKVRKDPARRFLLPSHILLPLCRGYYVA